jgi:drug/metabolite transporter (DMT)-like permease
LTRPFALYTLLMLMVLFWSGNYIAGKIALREFSPVLLAAVRIGIAGLIMLPVYLWKCGARMPGGRDVVRLLVLGVFGVTLNQLFFILGLSRTSVAHSSLIIGMTPVMVLLMARLRGLERITPLKAAGMAIAFAGLVLLRAFEPPNGTAATWLGDFYILLTALAFAIFTVFGKEETARHGAIAVNGFAYVGGAITLAPVFAGTAARHSLADVSAGGWLAAVYMALFASVIAYLIYYYALGQIDASRVSAFSYLQPVFATAMGAALLGERIGATEIAGGLVILSGVCLAERG